MKEIIFGLFDARWTVIPMLRQTNSGDAESNRGSKSGFDCQIEEFLARDPEVTAPLAIEVAIEEGEPMGRRLANVLKHADPGLAVRLHDQIPGRTTALQEAAIIVTAQIPIAAQRLPGIPLTAIASTRISLAYRLSESGRRGRRRVSCSRLWRVWSQLYAET
ncbi:MAG UNVERIFIED_CONTAM: hypothetical protein LVR18_42150 [Planctomycetaceae bacterium]